MNLDSTHWIGTFNYLFSRGPTNKTFRIFGRDFFIWLEIKWNRVRVFLTKKYLQIYERIIKGNIAVLKNKKSGGTTSGA